MENVQREKAQPNTPVKTVFVDKHTRNAAAIKAAEQELLDFDKQNPKPNLPVFKPETWWSPGKKTSIDATLICVENAHVKLRTTDENVETVHVERLDAESRNRALGRMAEITQAEAEQRQWNQARQALEKSVAARIAALERHEKQVAGGMKEKHQRAYAKQIVQIPVLAHTRVTQPDLLIVVVRPDWHHLPDRTKRDTFREVRSNWQSIHDGYGNVWFQDSAGKHVAGTELGGGVWVQ